MKNVPNNLSCLERNVDKLDVDKLVPVPKNSYKLVPDLSKLSDVVKNDVLKKDVYYAKIKDIEDKIPDVTNKIPSITKFATNASLNA